MLKLAQVAETRPQSDNRSRTQSMASTNASLGEPHLYPRRCYGAHIGEGHDIETLCPRRAGRAPSRSPLGSRIRAIAAPAIPILAGRPVGSPNSPCFQPGSLWRHRKSFCSRQRASSHVEVCGSHTASVVSPCSHHQAESPLIGAHCLRGDDLAHGAWRQVIVPLVVSSRVFRLL